MHPFRPIVLAGVGFAAVSLLLPFASFPVLGSVNGVSGDAWPALLPLTPLMLLAITGRWDRGLEAAPGITAVLLGAASVIFSFVKVADAVTAVRDTSGAGIGAGSWVLAAATLVATAGAAYGLLSRT